MSYPTNVVGDHNWSFELARRLPARSMFTAAYVGNASRKLLNGGNLRNINAVPDGAMPAPPNANAQDFRPFRLYNAINVIPNDFYSNFNALQATIRKHTGSFNIQASYTFSNVLGIRNNGASQATGTNRDANYGVLEFDRTHIFSVAYNWEIGRLIKRGNPFLRGVANGWQISGITAASSGVELAANDASNFDIAGQLPDGTALQQTAITGTPKIRAQPFLICDPRRNPKAAQRARTAFPGIQHSSTFKPRILAPHRSALAFWRLERYNAKHPGSSRSTTGGR